MTTRIFKSFVMATFDYIIYVGFEAYKGYYAY